MAHTVEHLDNCLAKISFTLDNIDLEKTILDSLSEKQKTATIKGYRSGKAPLSLIKKLYFQEIQEKALHQHLLQNYEKAVTGENLQVIEYPRFSKPNLIKKDEKISQVTFDAFVEIYPEFRIENYKNLELKKESVIINEEDVQAQITELLKSKNSIEEIQDKNQVLENGFMGVIKVHGKCTSDPKIEEIKNDELLVEIGNKSLNPDLEKEVIGLKKGETKEFSISYSDDESDLELAGKTIDFSVEILEIKKRIIPELNDEIAKELKYKDAKQLKEKLKKHLTLQKSAEVDSKFQESALKKLIEKNPFMIPNTFIQKQKKAVQEDVEKQLQSQQWPKKNIETYFEKWTKELEEKAIFQVKASLIVNELIKELKIEAKDEDIETRYQEISSDLDMPTDKVKEIYNAQEDTKKNLLHSIKERKLFDCLINLK